MAQGRNQLTMPQEIQAFSDNVWTKTRYRQDPIWEETEDHIRDVVIVTGKHPDMQPDKSERFYGVEQESAEYKAQRQVALAIYANIHDKFQGSSDMLQEMTRNQQSHWNFMLLGTAAQPRIVDGEGDNVGYFDTVFFGRMEQVVTLHFLCKCLKRLRIQGVEFNWKQFKKMMGAGDRYRLMSSPSGKEARAKWVKKYGEMRPCLEYPAPWKIAEEFRSVRTATTSFTSDVCKVNAYKKTGDVNEIGDYGIELVKDFEYTFEMRSARIQNDGVFFIPADGPAQVESGLFIAEVKPWFLKGMDQPDGLAELDDPSINRARFKEILQVAIQQATEAEQRAGKLQLEVGALRQDNEDLKNRLKHEKVKVKKLTDRLKMIDQLTQFSSKGPTANFKYAAEVKLSPAMMFGAAAKAAEEQED